MPVPPSLCIALIDADNCRKSWKEYEAILSPLVKEFRELETFADPFTVIKLSDIAFAAICDKQTEACKFSLLSLKEVVRIFPEARHYPDLIQKIDATYRKNHAAPSSCYSCEIDGLAQDLLVELKFGGKSIPKLLDAVKNGMGEDSTFALKALQWRLKKCPEERTPALAFSLLDIVENNRTLYSAYPSQHRDHVSRNVLDVLACVVEAPAAAQTGCLDEKLSSICTNTQKFSAETRNIASLLQAKMESQRRKAEKSLHSKNNGLGAHPL